MYKYNYNFLNNIDFVNNPKINLTKIVPKIQNDKVKEDYKSLLEKLKEINVHIQCECYISANTQINKIKEKDQ